MTRSSTRRRRKPWWSELPDRDLLEVRLSDLDLDWRSTWLAGVVDRLYEELESASIRLRPHVWLSTEWFSPDGVPGIAVPFFLADDRLMRLEKRMMLSVEGGRERECMRLLRHEAGHAVCTAFRLHRRARWRKAFGLYGKPYPDSYAPRTSSRHYVQHLAGWYAQAHPAEDFAETFAVWLNPNSRWRSRYRDWPALAKLEAVDEMIESIAGTTAPTRSRRHVEPVSGIRETLREFYSEKQDRYGRHAPTVFDEDLLRLFSDDPRHHRRETAVSFLRRARPRIRATVARWTGEVPYTVDQVIGDMIERCKSLELRLAMSPSASLDEASVLVAVHTTRFMHRLPHRIAM